MIDFYLFYVFHTAFRLEVGPDSTVELSVQGLEFIRDVFCKFDQVRLCILITKINSNKSFRNRLFSLPKFSNARKILFNTDGLSN